MEVSCERVSTRFASTFQLTMVVLQFEAFAGWVTSCESIEQIVSLDR
jgi:hypothetical protein